ncbi:unnamed protein product, partial [Medioppia subpectinata]
MKENDEIVLTRELTKASVTPKKSSHSNGDSKFVAEVTPKQTSQYRTPDKQQPINEQKTTPKTSSNVKTTGNQLIEKGNNSS